MVASVHLVTGASDGIGLETAHQLAARGLHVLVHGRTEARAVAACTSLTARNAGAALTPVWGDFSQLSEVRALAALVEKVAPRLDVLINNAGVFMKHPTLTADGFETTFQVNHLAPFLLTRLLLPRLHEAEEARIINVSSMAHASGRLDFDDLQAERRYEGYGAYAMSKLANVFFTHALARRLAGTKVTTHALHPGVIDTKLLRTGFGRGGNTLESGARTSVRCATDPSLRSMTGKYFSDERQTPCAPHAVDEGAEERLWKVSSSMVHLDA